MFARAATYEVPVDRIGEARDAFESAIAHIRDSPGLAEALLLVGTESGRVLTITFWEDHAAVTASRVSASRLRSEAAAAVGGHVVTVEEYEVAVSG
jgi:heme-degrading monooxygenase HmoA